VIDEQYDWSPYPDDMLDAMKALFAAMGQSEVRTVVDGERTVYEHVFTFPTGSIGFIGVDPKIQHIQLDIHPGKPIKAKYTLRSTHSFEKILARCRREWCWKKIKRRQIRAAQRRKRRGLA
jgi:hypothetical protein